MLVQENDQLIVLFDVFRGGRDIGPVYMVSGTRDNPPAELPWTRYFPTHLFTKFYQPFT